MREQDESSKARRMENQKPWRWMVARAGGRQLGEVRRYGEIGEMLGLWIMMPWTYDNEGLTGEVKYTELYARNYKELQENGTLMMSTECRERGASVPPSG